MELTRDKKIGLAIILAFVLLAIGLTVYLKISTGSVSKETRDLFTSTVDSPTYTDIHGNQVQLDEYLGKILVVNSFASWSPFSETDLANLDELAKTFSDEDVVFLAINRKESKEQVQRYIATLPSYDHIRFVIDQEDRFYLSVGGYAMPETLIFATDGTIIEQVRGSVTKDVLAAKITEQLAK